MKFSEKWLREWVNPSLNTKQLTDQLTMAGLEVDNILPVANAFNEVVVGEVLNVDPHPNADRLTVCKVNIGEDDHNHPLQIVCGAKNVRPGLKVPVAKMGAVLSPELTIKSSKLRGVESSGMLCSATELGLAEKSEGLLELPFDAPVGMNIREYLQLEDNILDLKVTTNRGDCLSIQGIAREVSALNQLPYKKLEIPKIPSMLEEQLPIKLLAPEACSQYLGRIIRNINIQKESPLWLKEKLRRSAIRAINPIVDVANYVMLELGQPLHSFDLNQIKGGITIRFAKDNEKIDLLNAQQVSLNEQTLLIADNNGPIAIAGVMGGIHSGISETTTDIFIESAYFDPLIIANSVQYYHLPSEAAHRYERGVDPQLQKIALERATELILQITGGIPGSISTITHHQHPSQNKKIRLRRDRISRILGITIPDISVKDILKRLGMTLEDVPEGWQVIPPSYRFDQHQEADLIEELVRIYGYNHVPNNLPMAQVSAPLLSESKINAKNIKRLLLERDYCEAITYSFISEKMQQMFNPTQDYKKLINPLSPDLAVMRTSLIPGLLQALIYNQNRQENRVRLFEIGLAFIADQQIPMLAGIASGSAHEEQWGIPTRTIDFFDVKADIEALLAITGDKTGFSFEVSMDFPQLHPHQASIIYWNDQKIGYLGALHPSIQKELGIIGNVYIFEINLSLFNNALIPKYEVISKFPFVRRDIAILVDAKMPVGMIQNKIIKFKNDLLKNVKLFDIYQGSEMEPGKKSVALSLLFQRTDRTLTDDEVNEKVALIIRTLETECNAKLRN